MWGLFVDNVVVLPEAELLFAACFLLMPRLIILSILFRYISFRPYSGRLTYLRLHKMDMLKPSTAVKFLEYKLFNNNFHFETETSVLQYETVFIPECHYGIA
jgi:hypothetical protein